MPIDQERNQCIHEICNAVISLFNQRRYDDNIQMIKCNKFLLSLIVPGV